MILLVKLFILSLVSFSQTQTYFQVITTRPEELKAISPYVQNRYEGGRLLIVNVKSPYATPKWVFNYLRPVRMQDVAHYVPAAAQLRNFKLPPIDQNYIKAIQLDQLKAGVAKLVSYKDRSSGSAENQMAQTWIVEQLSQWGYQVSRVCHQPKICSIVAQKIGLKDPKSVILVEGHLDSVGEKFAGADDNATGTSATLEIARVLSKYPNNNTLRFFLTNGEEQGMLGSTFYVKNLVASGEIKNLKLVVNMDMVGYNSNGTVELETDKEWNSVALWFAQLTATYTQLKSKITLGAFGSDHVPFLKAGVPTLLTIEFWATKTPCYHQECDKYETVNFPYMYEITKLNTAAVLTADVPTGR